MPVEIKYKGKTHFTLNFLLYSLLTFTNVASVCEMEKQQNNGRWGNFTVYVKHIYIYITYKFSKVGKRGSYAKRKLSKAEQSMKKERHWGWGEKEWC